MFSEQKEGGKFAQTRALCAPFRIVESGATREIITNLPLLNE
jgi:hypothetical protein